MSLLAQGLVQPLNFLAVYIVDVRTKSKRFRLHYPRSFYVFPVDPKLLYARFGPMGQKIWKISGMSVFFFCLLLSVVWRLSSIVCRLSSVVCYLSSVICRLSSVVCCLVSVVSRRSVMCRHSFVVCRLSALKCMCATKLSTDLCQFFHTS